MTAQAFNADSTLYDFGQTQSQLLAGLESILIATRDPLRCFEYACSQSTRFDLVLHVYTELLKWARANLDEVAMYEFIATSAPRLLSKYVDFVRKNIGVRGDHYGMVLADFQMFITESLGVEANGTSSIYDFVNWAYTAYALLCNRFGASTPAQTAILNEINQVVTTYERSYLVVPGC